MLRKRVAEADSYEISRSPYLSVAGLLIERGGILSHSAIVARAMGLPTIVGIPGLVATLQTGQRVTMAGAAGTVQTILSWPVG
jgi:phosphoenolpyruvate-protein kinase (PTS system EI component)